MKEEAETCIKNKHLQIALQGLLFLIKCQGRRMNSDDVQDEINRFWRAQHISPPCNEVMLFWRLTAFSNEEHGGHGTTY